MSPIESSRHVGRRPTAASHGESGRTATNAPALLGRGLLVLLVLAALLCCAAAEPQPQGGDWNALSGMWGKRASDWNRLSGMWGKRGPYGPYQALLLRAEESNEGAGHGISARAAAPGALRENHWNDLSGYWG
ncbi:unnamed protein product [Ixodes hexagonus]